ncbi:MAG: EAL domain-containing protein [Phycisphaerales bacterium]|nr:EAL domain-containing protein [Phycisphaerales bacterium]
MIQPRTHNRILLVDDTPEIHGDFQRILGPQARADAAIDALEQALFGEAPAPAPPAQTFRIESALQGAEAVDMVRIAADSDDPFTLAFVDMRMPPGMDGLETIEQLWGADPEVQIVVCTAYSDHPWAEIVARLGRSDRLLLLKKPFDHSEVWQLALALTQKWNLARQAALKLDELRSIADRANKDLLEQIKRRAEVEERLRFLAYHDPVTGLPNRRFLHERIEHCIRMGQRSPEFKYALLYLDLDNFKLINDTMGHDRGDKLLQDAANRIRSCLRALDGVARVEEDTAARVGGDEFIILLEGLRDYSDSARVAERCLQVLAEPFLIEGRELVVRGSIGVTSSERGYDRAEDVLRDADPAMYRAKGLGKGQFVHFDPAMHEEARRRLEIEGLLRAAIEQQNMSIAYQPIVDVKTGDLVGFEALLRCHIPGLPGDTMQLVQVAEETGLIVPMGRWVFARACSDFASWRTRYPHAGALRLNVNVSRRELVSEDLLPHVTEVLHRHGVPPGLVSVEVTESGVLTDLAEPIKRLHALRELGLQLHMDDFGTGYSSLACLHSFPLSAVKIDRQFTATMTHDSRYIAVVNAIVTLCHALNMRVTVEGIETAEQLELVDSLGCDSAQGYLFARPMSPEAVDQLLGRGEAGMRLAA